MRRVSSTGSPMAASAPGRGGGPPPPSSTPSRSTTSWRGPARDAGRQARLSATIVALKGAAKGDVRRTQHSDLAGCQAGGGGEDLAGAGEDEHAADAEGVGGEAGEGGADREGADLQARGGREDLGAQVFGRDALAEVEGGGEEWPVDDAGNGGGDERDAQVRCRADGCEAD